MDTSIHDDILKSVRNGLSLECDAKLLQYMEIISNKLISRAQTTSQNIDNLSSDLQRTSIALDNVTNRLSSLSHTKFIENRVYDDDETITNIKEVPVEIKSKEYNPIKTLNTVIKNNLKMLDNCYEKVSVELDDSDEEDEQIKSIVYRPKNKFETRPIPHLIGSKEWKENWHIGIYDSDESFSENENEEFSEGSDSLSLPSNGPTISESGSSLWSVNQNSKMKLPNKRNDYTSSDEEISTTSKTSSIDNKQRNIPQIPSTHEQRFYVHQPKERKKGLFDESSESDNENNKINVKKNKDLNENNIPQPLPRKSTKQSIESNKISNIFSDEPPELDTVAAGQNNKPTTNLFFDSDEGELFNENDKKPNAVAVAAPQSDNVRKKTVNLFDDDDFNSFMKELDQKTNETATKDTNRKRNLFDDETEEVIKPSKQFEEITDKRNEIICNEVPNEVKSNIINDSNLNKVQSEPDSKKIEKSLYTNLFDDDEDEIFSSTVKPNSNFLEKSTINQSNSKTQIANLFDDTPPDDEFDNLFKTSSIISKESSNIENIPKPKSPILIGDNQESLKNPILKSSTIIRKNLFDDDTDEEDINNLKEQITSGYNSLLPENDDKKNSETLDKLENSSSVDQTNEHAITKSSSNTKDTSENLISTNNILFNDAKMDESENISNKNINEVIHNENINESKKSSAEELKKTKTIFSSKTPVSSSLFDDIPEDDDEFFKSLKNTRKNNKLSEDSIKNIEYENKILNNTLQTVQNSNYKNNIFDCQTSGSVENIKTLDDQSEIETTNNDQLQITSQDDTITEPKEEIESLAQNTEILNKINDVGSSTNSVHNELLDNNTDSSNDLNSWKLPEKTEHDGHCEYDEKNKILNANEEKEIEKIPNIEEKSLNKQATHSIFMPTIFDDTPPDDDDDIFSSSIKNNLNETEIFESSTDNYNFNKTQISPNTSNYDSVVFQDTTPPDDNNDDDTSLFSSKNDKFTTSSIYSSKPLTQANNNTSEKSEFKTNYMFDDGPPADSFDYKSEEIDENVNSKQSEIIEEKSLSVSDLIKKVTSPNKESDTQNSNNKPVKSTKKLSSNLNINVAALLPGAKRPVSVNFNDESDGNILPKSQTPNSEEESKIDLNRKTTESTMQKYSIDKETTHQPDNNILISLNKNRATIPKKRRPSTKQGRLDNYRKSLVEPEEIDNSVKSINIKNENVPENTQQVKKDKISSIWKPNTHSLFSDETDGNDNWLSKSITNDETLNEQRSKHVTENFSSEHNKMISNKSNNEPSSTVQSEVQNKKNSSFLFTDGNDDDKDWLFEATSKLNANEEKIINKEKNPVVNEVSKDLDNDLLFKTKSNLPETKSETKKVFDPLYFDDEDENDLFSGNSVIRATKIKFDNKLEKNTASTEQQSRTENEIFKKVKNYKKNPTKNEAIPETIQKISKPDEKPQSKSKGLFDSDDDDDDLFGNNNANNKKIIIKKNISSMQTNKKLLNVTKKSNLFDDIDDDDDDDLFGTKTNKAQSAVTKKNLEKPKIVQSQGESTDYNPLADLLNDK